MALPVQPSPVARTPKRDSGADIVGLLASSAEAEVVRAVNALGFDLECFTRVDLLVARVESNCPGIIIVDTDVLGCPDALCRLARSLRGDVRLIGLLNFWCEREDGVAACMDAILHKPPRAAEWEAVVNRLVAGGS